MTLCNQKPVQLFDTTLDNDYNSKVSAPACGVSKYTFHGDPIVYHAMSGIDVYSVSLKKTLLSQGTNLN